MLRKSLQPLLASSLAILRSVIDRLPFWEYILTLSVLAMRAVNEQRSDDIRIEL